MAKVNNAMQMTSFRKTTALNISIISLYDHRRNIIISITSLSSLCKAEEQKSKQEGRHINKSSLNYEKRTTQILSYLYLHFVT